MKVELLVFFLNLGERVSDVNDDNDFGILLHIEEATVVK